MLRTIVGISAVVLCLLTTHSAYSYDIRFRPDWAEVGLIGSNVVLSAINAGDVGDGRGDVAFGGLGLLSGGLSLLYATDPENNHTLLALTGVMSGVLGTASLLMSRRESARPRDGGGVSWQMSTMLPVSGRPSVGPTMTVRW